MPVAGCILCYPIQVQCHRVTTHNSTQSWQLCSQSLNLNKTNTSHHRSINDQVTSTYLISLAILLQTSCSMVVALAIPFLFLFYSKVLRQNVLTHAEWMAQSTWLEGFHHTKTSFCWKQKSHCCLCNSLRLPGACEKLVDQDWSRFSKPHLLLDC